MIKRTSKIGVAALALAGALMLFPASLPPASAQTVLRDSVPVSLKRDYERSQTLWVDMAERGDAKAQTALGFLYLIGLWLDPDDQKAFNWFEAAAFQGVPQAQYYLGTMYLKGRGIGANAPAAYFWCELAVAQGLTAERPLAFSCREEAARSMNPEDVREAMVRVKSWNPPK
jgi:TPR repeat protein